MIETVREICGTGAASFVKMICTKRKKPIPKEADSTVVYAEINHGRWIVKCPWCAGAELADKQDKRFFCLSCFNSKISGKYAKVEFPDEIKQIEKELLKRDIKNQNWLPGEILEQLKSEVV